MGLMTIVRRAWSRGGELIASSRPAAGRLSADRRPDVKVRTRGAARGPTRGRWRRWSATGTADEHGPTATPSASWPSTRAARRASGSCASRCTSPRRCSGGAASRARPASGTCTAPATLRRHARLPERRARHRCAAAVGTPADGRPTRQPLGLRLRPLRRWSAYRPAAPCGGRSGRRRRDRRRRVSTAQALPSLTGARTPRHTRGSRDDPLRVMGLAVAGAGRRRRTARLSVETRWRRSRRRSPPWSVPR